MSEMKLKPNYKVFSAVGMGMMFLGVVSGNIPILTIGLIFLIVGVNKQGKGQS